MINDPAIDDREWARREGLGAFAGLPLLVDGQLVGVMALFSRKQLDETSTDALTTVARTVAVGIERKRLEDQLRHSQKMEALGQLAGGVAHDFNNLLTVVSGNCSLLLDSGSLPEDARRFVEEIDYAGVRAAGLTRQLLAFGRVQPLSEENHDLSDLLTDIEKMLRRLIGENITLIIDSREGPAIVSVDRGQFEQVIVNLAVNARDAMPDGGLLTLLLKRVVLDAPLWYNETEVAPGDYIVLSVTDTGTGIPREVAQRIFEPYFTTKEKGKGTGLGLATVYGIIKQSAGHIHVYSEPGIGTTFTIYLPRRESVTGRRKSDPPNTHLPRGTETVLLVEDDNAVRGLGRQILTKCGYRVMEAANGCEALAIATAFEGQIDIVVSDVIMPEMGGREMLERMALSRPEMRALFVSGYTDDAVLRQGALLPGTGFLQKPFTPKALATSIRDILDRS